MPAASPFLEDLRQYGPEAPDRSAPSVEAARAYCARLTAAHYENFSVVTWLTPRDLRPAFASIYAFCRWSDDLGDELGDPERSRALLGWWRSEVLGLYQGRAPKHPVLVALAETVEAFKIPVAPFLALISAFEQDQSVTDYDTYARLLDYCRRSANPVGHLVLYLGRAFDEERAMLADLTCTGLQLTNFWQDVARDYALGRVYLPREDRARFGVTDADLAARRFTPEFAALLAFEVGRARDLLLRGQWLMQSLPPSLALDVDLFNRGGLAVLDLIASQGYDVLSARPSLSKGRKLALLASALWRRRSRRRARASRAALARPYSAPAGLERRAP